MRCSFIVCPCMGPRRRSRILLNTCPERCVWKCTLGKHISHVRSLSCRRCLMKVVWKVFCLALSIDPLWFESHCLAMLCLAALWPGKELGMTSSSEFPQVALSWPVFSYHLSLSLCPLCPAMANHKAGDGECCLLQLMGGPQKRTLLPSFESCNSRLASIQIFGAASVAGDQPGAAGHFDCSCAGVQGSLSDKASNQQPRVWMCESWP